MFNSYKGDRQTHGSACLLAVASNTYKITLGLNPLLILTRQSMHDTHEILSTPFEGSWVGRVKQSRRRGGLPATCERCHARASFTNAAHRLPGVHTSSRAHDGYRAGSRRARPIKVAQAKGKEVRLSAKASGAAAHNKPDQRWP